MTERPLSISTQSATLNQTAFNATGPVSANDALTAVTESVDEEPYTIKCICNYTDDDGNTIYCEKCDTWQHIECFYPGRVADASRAEFDHSCIDCNPRQLDLDRDNATERQRSQRHNKASNDTGDKKHKRPPSKSHKKKPRPSELQVNGYHDRDGHSPQDTHPTTKKARGHKSRESISSQIKRSPPYNARPSSHGLPPSPAHTPPDLPQGHDIHGYSDLFTTLYNDEDTVELNNSNKFANLGVPDTLAKWLQDPVKLQEDVGIDDRHKIMPNVKVEVNTIKWAELRVESTPIPDSDRNLHCRSLITPRSFVKSDVVGELNGLVGFQRDFNDTDKPVEGYAHSKPFVFYVPRLPLFIDTRREGSISRFVRRSCRANTGLETFIDPRRGSQYHFWLVSERPIAANDQITIPWDFRFPKKYESRFLHFMNLSDEDGDQFEKSSLSEEEYEMLSGTINLVLSDYGGCACGLQNDCAFARFHRNYHGRLQAQSNGVKSKKGRKPKQNHVSPTGTSHANSRAASEGHPEQFDDDDRRSISGSSRSKPNSRDLTPLHGVGETNGILTEVTDREKRKLAMAEESFRRMEQGQPPRKKKRASDGATPANPVAANPKPRQKSVAPRPPIQTPNTNGTRKTQHIETSTARRQSVSPYSAISPTGVFPFVGNDTSRPGSIQPVSRPLSAGPKATYADSSAQTECEPIAWYSPPARPSTSGKPKKIIPLSTRFFRNRRMLKEERQTQLTAVGIREYNLANSPTLSMDLDTAAHDAYRPESPIDARGRRGSIASSSASVDNATSVEITMAESPTMAGTVTKPPPPVWSGSPATALNSTPGPRSSELKVQLPPTPNFSVPNMSGPLSSSGTPSSAIQSPFGTGHFPGSLPGGFLSPINGLTQLVSPLKAKKKMSLSDYKKKNAMKTEPPTKTGSSPTVAPAVLKQPLSTIDEASAPGVIEGSLIPESPAEKKHDPMDTMDLSSNYLPSELPNGVHHVT